MIYESDTINREKLEKLRKANVCAVCGEWLNTYLGEKGLAFIACKDYLRTGHEGIAKEAKYFEENIPTKRERMEKQMGTEQTRGLERYSHGALATETDAMRVLETIWPKAPALEKKKAAMLCVQYQLNPLMRHVFLIPFKTKSGGETWATVLGIQANRLIAHRAGSFSYVDDTPRVMAKEEQERIFGEVFEDRLWAITKLKDNQGNTAVGYGFWMKSDNPYGSDKGNTKANMAFIRSERQAMDRLFAGKMPEETFEIADERFVDTDTGEIIEGGAVETIKEPKPQPQTKGEHADKPKSQKTAVADPEPEPEETPPNETTEVLHPKEDEPSIIDLDWLKESLETLQWAECVKWLNNKYGTNGKRVSEIVKMLTPEQQEEFAEEVQSRLDLM